ncbi:MAG: D-alanyl-D-alanine carboxypeptidase family protein [Archangiaceae bacterium]|nr:D-alanyl-D-alanine carboxypeptidase family protein [Archangiaceae bacterium]
MRTTRIAVALLSCFASGCGVSDITIETGESEPLDEGDTTAQALVTCSYRTDTGYRDGSPFQITVVDADGKPAEVGTANAYSVMQAAAASQGVALRVVSGFRTMAEQQYLYHCYLSGSCNGGNLAATPGYSNHQSGRALDLNTSSPGVAHWLAAHGAAYGFRPTVPGEAWHYEWLGGGPGGGPCRGGTAVGSDGCTAGQRAACGNFGCGCADGKCSGGYACEGNGCTAKETTNCGNFGCGCVDHKCSGGFCPGTGASAKVTRDCANFGCQAVDMKCAGGFCPGSGCTAKETRDCGNFGCGCVDHRCSGGFCEGSGATAKVTLDCAKVGCSAVDMKCAGGFCPGNGCTAKETRDCGAFGCGCANHQCSGGFCPVK